MRTKPCLMAMACVPALLAVACGGEPTAELTAVAASTTTSSPAAVAADTTPDMSETATMCGGCHSGPLSFAGQKAADLAAAYGEMLKGGTHPTPLPELTDEQLAELLKTLTSQ